MPAPRARTPWQVAPGHSGSKPAPGDGLLTEALAAAGLRVVAVEKDARSPALLLRQLMSRPNVACRRAVNLTFPWRSAL